MVGSGTRHRARWGVLGPIALLWLAGCGAYDAQRLAERGAPGPGQDHGAGVPERDGGSDGDVHATPDAGGAGSSSAGTSGSGSGGRGSSPTPARDAGGNAEGGSGGGDGSVVTPAPSDAGDMPDAATESDGGDAGCAGAIGGGDPCTSAAALPAPPVIDGELDCGVTPSSITPTAWNGTAAMPSGHTTQLAVAHRPDGLYFYVEVRGQAPAPHPAADAIYCGDAIELYVDADGVLDAAGAYDAPGTMQIIVAAPASDAAPNPHAERFLQGATQGAWTSTAWQVRYLADGYALEAFVVAADLGLSTWAPSAEVGIDLVLDVAGPAGSPGLRCGLLLGQYFLRVQADATACGGEPWCDARAFCTPLLE